MLSCLFRPPLYPTITASATHPAQVTCRRLAPALLPHCLWILFPAAAGRAPPCRLLCLRALPAGEASRAARRGEDGERRVRELEAAVATEQRVAQVRWGLVYLAGRDVRALVFRGYRMLWRCW